MVIRRFIENNVIYGDSQFKLLTKCTSAHISFLWVQFLGGTICLWVQFLGVQFFHSLLLPTPVSDSLFICWLFYFLINLCMFDFPFNIPFFSLGQIHFDLGRYLLLNSCLYLLINICQYLLLNICCSNHFSTSSFISASSLSSPSAFGTWNTHIHILHILYVFIISLFKFREGCTKKGKQLSPHFFC